MNRCMYGRTLTTESLDTYVRSIHTRFGGCRTMASNTGRAVYVAEGRDFVAN